MFSCRPLREGKGEDGGDWGGRMRKGGWEGGSHKTSKKKVQMKVGGKKVQKVQTTEQASKQLVTCRRRQGACREESCNHGRSSS